MRTRKQAQESAAAAREAINEVTAQAQYTQRLAQDQERALGDVKAQIEEYWEDSDD
jgi:hypothetical protein